MGEKENNKFCSIVDGRSVMEKNKAGPSSAQRRDVRMMIQNRVIREDLNETVGPKLYSKAAEMM